MSKSVNPSTEESTTSSGDDWFETFRFKDPTGLELGCSESRKVFSRLEYKEGQYERIFGKTHKNAQIDYNITDDDIARAKELSEKYQWEKK